MAPAPEQISVALSALRADARTWASVSDELATARRNADRLDLTIFHFTALGDAVGLTDLYGALQRKMSGLMKEAEGQFDALSTALRTAADGYEEDDLNSAHRIQSIY